MLGEGVALRWTTCCVVVVVALGYDDVYSLEERPVTPWKGEEWPMTPWRGGNTEVWEQGAWEATMRSRGGQSTPGNWDVSVTVASCDEWEGELFFKVRREGSVVCFQGKISCLLWEKRHILLYIEKNLTKPNKSFLAAASEGVLD